MVIGLVLICILLAGCSSNMTGSAIKEDKIKIGWIGPLTGDAAIIGEENLKGVQVAVNEINSIGGINGKQVELIVKDDQMNDRETITQFRQLVDVHGVEFIMTVTYGGFLSLAEQAELDDVLLIDSLDTSEELAGLGENVFAIGVYDESIGFAIADHLNSEEVESVGVIFNLEDPFILLAEESFESRFEGVVDKESYNFDTKDFRTILTKLSDNDKLVLFGWEETGLIVRQAKELGIGAEIIGIDTFASEDFRKNSNFQHEGLVFSFWQGSEENVVFDKFMVNHNMLFGSEPENVLFAVVGHDAMSVLGESMQGCVDIDCVKFNLRNVRNFPGASGLITMDQDGITRSVEESMHMYQNGEIVSL